MIRPCTNQLMPTPTHAHVHIHTHAHARTHTHPKRLLRLQSAALVCCGWLIVSAERIRADGRSSVADRGCGTNCSADHDPCKSAGVRAASCPMDDPKSFKEIGSSSASSAAASASRLACTSNSAAAEALRHASSAPDAEEARGSRGGGGGTKLLLGGGVEGGSALPVSGEAAAVGLPNVATGGCGPRLALSSSVATALRTCTHMHGCGSAARDSYAGACVCVCVCVCVCAGARDACSWQWVRSCV